MNRSRRHFLRIAALSPAAVALASCRASLPLPFPDESHKRAMQLVTRSADAHGVAQLAALTDISVSYSGHWRFIVSKVQPDLVDSGYRGGSQERLLIAEQLLGQSHAGPQGHKQVVRQIGSTQSASVRVWFNDQESADASKQDAAALVADAYTFFLLGPMQLMAYLAQPGRTTMQLAVPAMVHGIDRRYDCEVVRMKLQPGIGRSRADELALYIDRDEHLMRRVRFTLEGLESTQGALVDVDVDHYVSLAGVRWPTQYHERLLRPAPLDVHRWQLTGLDVNRGLVASQINGSRFVGEAVRDASTLSG